MFFEAIYRWFISLYGYDLADYLSGYVCPSEESEGGYLASNQFLVYGFVALGIAFVVTLIYYYVINHPRFNKLWSWLIVLLLVGISNLLIGALMTIGDLGAGNIGDCLINGENGGIYNSNCWMFGLANFLISAAFFIIFSVGLKWWSKNCKRTPF